VAGSESGDEVVNILFLSQLLPYPPDAGAKVRSYYTLRWLAERHAVTLVAFTRPDDPPEAVAHLRQFCNAVHTVPMRRNRIRDGLALAGSLLHGESFIIHRDRSAEMDTLLQRLVRETAFDAVHADQLWMAQYAIHARNQVPRFRLNVQTLEHSNVQRFVLDEHNACFQIFERLARGDGNAVKRWLWRREAGRLRQYEGEVCGQFDRVVTVTEGDREILEELSQREAGSGVVFSTIPICVDTEEVKAVQPLGEGMNVLHLGTMFWPPNVEGVLWFLREVWPLVRHELPEVSISVVGKNPPAELATLAEGQNVTLTGYVPDPLPWLQQAGIFVVPLLSGGGMRVKIVEAWRWGLPIVSTSIGAEGIEYIDGENILIADSRVDFAEAIVRVLRDPEMGRRLRVNGRQWVESHYEWRAVYSAWDVVYG
jgi:glycosyltransferase involved in cell wall biosynthesis